MALEHPVYAYGGALAVPVAAAATWRAIGQGPNAQRNTWMLIGTLAGAAALSHWYANRPGISDEARSFAEGAALSTGGTALAGTVALLFGM
jgi:hypothetical protein